MRTTPSRRRRSARVSPRYCARPPASQSGTMYCCLGVAPFNQIRLPRQLLLGLGGSDGHTLAKCVAPRHLFHHGDRPQRDEPVGCGADQCRDGRDQQYDRLRRVADRRFQQQPALAPGCRSISCRTRWGRSGAGVTPAVPAKCPTAGMGNFQAFPQCLPGCSPFLDRRFQQLEDEQEQSRSRLEPGDVRTYAGHDSASAELGVLQLQHGVMGRRFRRSQHVST